jgi:hypothetical protein
MFKRALLPEYQIIAFIKRQKKGIFLKKLITYFHIFSEGFVFFAPIYGSDIKL